MDNDHQQAPAQQLKTWQQVALDQIEQAKNNQELENIRVEYLGRKGHIAQMSKVMPKLKPEEKKVVGRALNETKNIISQALEKKQESIATDQNSKPSIEDPTIPGDRPHLGHLHPTTELMREVNNYFRKHGYSVYDGPEIENNEYNFEKLNLPTDHPARDLADTLYIHEPEVLMRTHTSSVEARALTNEELPLRIVVPGKVYRNETTNLTNNSMFYQYEGLVVDHNLSMANLKATLEDFVKFIYGPDVKTRFRCKYYPQVEPGAGLDIQCSFCKGAGCPTCKHRGWIEVLGSGMVHPNMLQACGIDPQEWSGFAFGLGFDRLVMLKYGIHDVRKLYNGDLVVEEQV